MGIQKLGKAAQGIITQRSKKDTKVSYADYINVDESIADDPPFACLYQTEWFRMVFEEKAPVMVWEKSRQIGASFFAAFIFVYASIVLKKDCLYTSYNKDSSKQFIKDCRKWAKVFNVVYKVIEKIEVIDDNSLNVFDLTFVNGATITASAGDSNNLRAKPGYFIMIDEAAYRRQSLSDLLAGATPAIIHGGLVIIASTHAGIDSDFNQTIGKIKSGELDYKHHKITFREAVRQGLYKSICRLRKKEWSQKLEDAWVESIYKMIGLRAIEELDVEPSDFTGGDKVFHPSVFKEIDFNQNDHDIEFYRYHDLAASSDDNADNFYSASVKIAYSPKLKCLIICDFEAEKLDPVAGDDNIKNIVKREPLNTIHLIEVEPGSSGIKYVEYMKNELNGYNVFGYRPIISKLKRAIPVANALNLGKIRIWSRMVDKEKFINTIRKFDGTKKPLVNDLTDCLSGIWDWWINSPYHKENDLGENNFDNPELFNQESGEYNSLMDDIDPFGLDSFF